jgi:gamma-glutamylcyclotransferase (GGCT)/AIG2-like uncharacterized protein YtfP
MHFYFAYGSNMNPERVQKRKMAFTEMFAGRLNDYRLVFNKRSTIYPGAASANVQRSRGDVVEGLLYQLSEENGIEAMDPFEGYPVRYDRFLLPVETHAGAVDAWVYIANQEYIQEGLQPASWYLRHLLEGKPHLSPDYYEQLAAVSCLPDSDLEP